MILWAGILRIVKKNINASPFLRQIGYECSDLISFADVEFHHQDFDSATDLSSNSP